MIWYKIPFFSVRIFFVLSLVTGCLQTIVALSTGEMLREKHSLRIVRLMYSLLALTSIAFAMEALIVIASVEGGVYLPITPVFRYTAVLPVLIFPYAIKTLRELPPCLRPCMVNCFIPLLMLLPNDLIPANFFLLIIVLVTLWFAMDAIRMLSSIRVCSQQEVPRSVISHIIRNMDHGVCIANRRGYILEANPAFYSMCKLIGINRYERINEINEVLMALREAGRLEIAEFKDGRSIWVGEHTYFLRQSTFLSDGKFYEELAISDVTQAARVTKELERENNMIEQENKRLEKAISVIESEASALERERLSRTAHDVWSQRLAVAGLSLDVLLDQSETERNADNNDLFQSILDSPEMENSLQTSYDLYDVLETLTATYQKLGVKIYLYGEAVFSTHEREVLRCVIREALANAVRHAYARIIDIHIFEDEKKSGVIVRNECLDDNTIITEGRGLYDIKARVQNAGGSVIYTKSDIFELRVTFKRHTNCS